MKLVCSLAPLGYAIKKRKGLCLHIEGICRIAIPAYHHTEKLYWPVNLETNEPILSK